MTTVINGNLTANVDTTKSMVFGKAKLNNLFWDKKRLYKQIVIPTYTYINLERSNTQYLIGLKRHLEQ